METGTQQLTTFMQGLEPTVGHGAHQGLDVDVRHDSCSAGERQAVPRVGSIYSYTTIHHPQAEGDAIHTLALVRLSHGPLVMGQIVGASEDRLGIGGAVELLRVESSQIAGTQASAVFFGLLD